MGSGGEVILYIGDESESGTARTLLQEAGFQFTVRAAPMFFRVAYGTPVLFALSNRYEGIEGIEAFMRNAEFLGYQRARSL